MFNNLDDTQRRFFAFTKEDSRKLQVLQNKTLRLRTGLNKYTPTKDLLNACNELSVNQLSAFHTLLSVHRVVRCEKPKTISDQMKLRTQKDELFLQRQANTIPIKAANLNYTKAGFCYRGSTLWNSMPDDLRKEEKYSVFKRKLKNWVSANIPPKSL